MTGQRPGVGPKFWKGVGVAFLITLGAVLFIGFLWWAFINVFLT